MTELKKLIDNYAIAIASLGCPSDIAKKAAGILARETLEGYSRTPDDQRIIDRAWRYSNGIPPIDGAVLSK